MTRLRPPLEPGDHIIGAVSAPVSIVEFGDYECPVCGSASRVVQELLLVRSNVIGYAFRHFPITAAHPHAMLAASAAEAAAVQGRFWQMHDLLYEHQDALALADLEEYAASIGLDRGQFARDLRAPEIAAKIRSHQRSGAVSGVNGTPTFFINGQRYDGSYDLLSLLEATRVGGEAESRR